MLECLETCLKTVMIFAEIAHSTLSILHGDASLKIMMWSLNVSKTKELIVDFRKRQQRPYTPLMVSGTPVERVSSFKYLSVYRGGPDLDCKHSDSGQESQAKTVSSTTAEKIQGLTSTPENFLFRGHRKCIDSLHLSVVLKRLQSGLQSSAECCALS